jgi:hypothetical protein
MATASQRVRRGKRSALLSKKTEDPKNKKAHVDLVLIVEVPQQQNLSEAPEKSPNRHNYSMVSVFNSTLTYLT